MLICSIFFLSSFILRPSLFRHSPVTCHLSPVTCSFTPRTLRNNCSTSQAVFSTFFTPPTAGTPISLHEQEDDFLSILPRWPPPVPTKTPQIPLPRKWNQRVKSAILHVISLARFSQTAATKNAAGPLDKDAEIERLRQQLALRDEIDRIKDIRMASISAHKRPRYPPTERLAILEVRAAQGWSLQRSAEVFQVTAQTIASWNHRIDEAGPDALVQTPEPVNKFPEHVRYLVQRLKTLCSHMGKKKIDETLGRAGLHLGPTTIDRILKEPPQLSEPRTTNQQPQNTNHQTLNTDTTPPTTPSLQDSIAPSSPRIITARRPNHVWHVDLTVVPTGSGFWCSWIPCALPQCWPFAWWLAVAEDHFSRRVMGHTMFFKQPTSEQVRAFLGRTMHKNQVKPKYIICDKGSQFDCAGFRAWCKHRQLKPRYGAVGKHRSIAVIERCILTVKLLLGLLPVIPLQREPFRQEVAHILDWYNEHRPHTTLNGRTPNEKYFSRRAANQQPRFEPRSRWPRGSPCARPQTLVKGQPGARLELIVTHHRGRKHLPVVSLKRAA